MKLLSGQYHRTPLKWVHIGLGNSMVLSVHYPYPEFMLIQICVDIWRQKARPVKGGEFKPFKRGKATMTAAVKFTISKKQQGKNQQYYIKHICKMIKHFFL